MIQNLVKNALTSAATQEKSFSKYAANIASKISSSGMRKKSYVDLMGILAILNYLKEQGYECKTERSLHKSPSILEKFEITDIYYNNFRIDVITNFNTNMTRVPKSHVVYGIMPDFYIVIKMAQNLGDFRILGFVKPQDVISSYHDSKYYYPDKRYPIKDMFNKISDKRKKPQSPVDKHIDCEALFLRFLENELIPNKKRSFIRHLLNCESCTKSFLSFEKYHRGMKDAEKYPNLHQGLYEKVTNSSAALYKKVGGVRREKDAFTKFISGIYDFSDNTIDFISNLSWDDKKDIEAHKTTTKKQEVEFIFKDKAKSIFNLEVFSKLFERRKVALLVGLIILIIGGAVVGLVSFGANKDRISFDEGQINGGEETNIDYTNQAGDFSETGESFKYGDYEMNAVEYAEENNIPNPSDIIKNISWEVPKKVSEDQEYLGFLQAAGKNIRLRLENDLVLSKEIPKNKNIKVDVQFSGDTSIIGLKIVKSSGSNSIDDLIQRNIVQTFTYMEQPNVDKENVTLTLVIDL